MARYLLRIRKMRRFAALRRLAEQDHRTQARASQALGMRVAQRLVAQAGMPVLLKARASLPASRGNGDRRKVCSLSSLWAWRWIALATFILRIMARVP